MELSWLHEPVTLLMATIGFIVWLAKVEFQGKVTSEMAKENKLDLKILEKKHDDAQEKITGHLLKIEMSLSKIEGKLEPRRKLTEE